MSVSRHPVALAAERRVGRGARLLATVMALPLLDGLFPTLLLAGALDDPLGVIEVGVLVFGGSATLAVVIAEFDGDRRETVGVAAGIGLAVVCLTAAEAALAPTVGQLVDLATFERFAAIVVLAVAARTASPRVGTYLPRPAVIVGLGLVASVDPARVAGVLATGPEPVAEPALVLHGSAAAAIGAGVAIGAAALGPWLRGLVDLDRFRFGSAVALGVLALSILGVVPGDVPLSLVVFGLAVLFALDPAAALAGIDPRGGAADDTAGSLATDGGAVGDRRGGPEVSDGHRASGAVAALAGDPIRDGGTPDPEDERATRR